MIRQKHHDDHQSYDYFDQESVEDLNHKKRIRRKLEDKLDTRRLMKELEDFDDLENDFDWKNFQR